MDDLLQEMIDPTPEPGDRPRRRRLVATIAIVGLAVVGITSLTTGAIFTDREQTADSFTTGTVDLSLGNDVDFDVAAQGLAPGDVYSSAVHVVNSGSLELRYAVTYTATEANPAATADTGDVIDGDAGDAARGDLRDYIKLDAWSVASEANCTATPAGTKLSTETTLVHGTETPLIGNVLQGQQNGSHGTTDPDRSLSAGTAGNEWLCFVVTMDKDAGNTLQNTGANIQLDFYAEQTKNN